MIALAKKKETGACSNNEIKERLHDLSSTERDLALDLVVLMRYEVLGEAMEKMPESPLDDLVRITEKLLKR